MFAKLGAFVACATSLVVATSVPSGFVTTKGTHFQLNGKPFYFAGTNSYWSQYTTNYDDINFIFKRANTAGLPVIRTWGFNDANATFTAGGLPMYSAYNSIAGQIVYQTWADGKVTINTGATGLQHFDKLVSIAEQQGVKLIVTLTNNWADYGGMDVYTINLGGTYHDEFYYNPTVIAAYKNWVKTVVTRYKNSPAIFAWELANEPRCEADGTRNLPRSPSGCTAATITTWADQISTYIKSLDPLHLVTLGDEGFFNEPGNSDWAYGGGDGIDFVANLKLKNLDFGTFHLYPDWWSKTVPWATQFVIDHATAQQQVGKPVIMEEYGWLSVAGREQNLGTTSNYTRVEAVGAWQEAALEHKLAGDLFWQFGLEKGLSTGTSTDDGFTIYLENLTESQPLIYNHVAAIKQWL
ncbi:glycoside hydrolase [Sistotremastrum niveocremeum HHB9708]|uniref:mannan endo-1,4-beta-mannosidase n=2 Tax=Sistotremastraceae TaxID=3402574 RepID=A0A164NYU8_9AGAM|nr:glycoside hydrolase [Sistotremastrum niveocremeum HHB9708]KZT36507.1 glycoside hydrolase [Sistotremastrum suecicum HHB10207 ss-3]